MQTNYARTFLSFQLRSFQVSSFQIHTGNLNQSNHSCTVLHHINSGHVSLKGAVTLEKHQKLLQTQDDTTVCQAVVFNIFDTKKRDHFKFE